MGKLKINFHPLFFIYVFLCLYFNWFNGVFYYVVTVTLHEYGHFWLARHYGYDMDKIIFSLNGAGIVTNNKFKPIHEIYISLAGPIVNALVILVLMALWWIYPWSYMFTYGFLISNICVMIFNLLPIYPLDGGRILVSLLCLKGFNRSRLMKISKCLCLILSLLFLLLFVVSIFFEYNVNLAIISMFLAITYLQYGKDAYFDKIKCLSKDNKRPIEIKRFRLNIGDKYELIKYLNPHYYSIFEYKNNGVWCVIEEDELINN